MLKDSIKFEEKNNLKYPDGLWLFDKLSSSLYDICGYTFMDNNPYIFFENINEIYRMVEILEIIHNKYNCGDKTNYTIITKEDMNFKVFVLSNCVIKICLTDLYYKKYEQIYKIIINLNHKNLEKIYEIFDTGKYTIIISKKIIPLFVNSSLNPILNIEIEEINFMIGSLINEINQNGLYHNDIRVDNMGYDQYTQEYILFDFDKSKYEFNGYNKRIKTIDNDDLYNSLMYIQRIKDKSYIHLI